MNIFQNAETFYGGESKEVTEVPLLSIFRLAKQIRLQLGPKGYLLDSYLDIVFQGLMIGSVSDVLEDGLNAAFDLQPSLLRHSGTCSGVPLLLAVSNPQDGPDI